MSSEQALVQSAQQYGNYLEFPEAKDENVVLLKDTVEHMLTQFDELNTVVDSVGLNIQQTKTLLGPLMTQSKQLEKTYALIDGLEIFLSELDAHIDQLESRVVQIEEQQNWAASATRAKDSALRMLSKVSIPGMRKSESILDTPSSPPTATPTTAVFTPIPETPAVHASLVRLKKQIAEKS